MGLTTEEFVSAFHTLSGVTIGERRKNLFKMLNDNTASNFDFTQLHPRTLLEQTLKLEVLKFYKNKIEILQMLKEENIAVIENIFKLDWFIKDAFGCMEAKVLVSEFFPNLSFNSKLKLLNKLCLLIKDSSKCDEYFLVVKETYGMYLASKLLPGCSQGIILNTLHDYKIEITPKQLLLMIQRNPSITEEVFEKLSNYDSKVDIGFKYRYVLKYLMQNDLLIFIHLNKKYNSYFQLGTRASRKFIANNKDACLTHSEKFHKVLKEVQIAKCLKENFSIVFSNIFPRSLQKLIFHFDDILSMLASFKDDDKLKLLLNTFKKHYDGDLLQHHHFMVPKVFEWMSLDYRERFLESTPKPKEIPEETWISFMDSKKSIPLIKDRILLTSNVKERVRWVKALVSTCKINKDEDALEDVCEYMVGKHRNDQPVVRHAFLESISSVFDLKKLQDRHWKYIKELLKPITINNESHWLSATYLEDYIGVCLDRNLPVAEYMKLWVQHSYSSYSIFNNKLNYRKRCLEAFADIIPMCFSKDQLVVQYSSYLLSVCWWNQKHPKEKISIFKRNDILSIVLDELQRNPQSYEAQQVAVHCIVSDFMRASELNLLETLLNNYEKLHITIDINWLLKHHPIDILPYLHSLVKHMVKFHLSDRKFREIYKQVVDARVKEVLSAACKDVVEAGEISCKKRALHILSVILAPEEFLQYVEQYNPQISTNTDPDSLTSYLQQDIPLRLQNVTPAHLTFAVLLKYCQGDYLKYAQNAMYYICNNVAEKKLHDFIIALSSRAVSVRKHSIILALKLLDKEATNIMLKKFMENEKNASLRKNLFKSIFNLFLRNPDEQLWQLVKDNIKAIGHDDTEAFCNLANSKRVPSAFFVKYLKFAWTTLDKLPYDDKLEEGKCQILEAVASDNIATLPNDFCLEIIENNLFQKSHLMLQNELNVFTVKYLLYSGYNDMNRVFSVIKKFLKASCKIVYEFVKTFCLFFVTKKSDNVNVLTLFSTCWNEIAQPFEALENYLHIQFTLIFVDCVKDKSIEQVGVKIAKTCNSLYERQSLDISIFKEVFINSFQDNLLEEANGNFDENKLLLADSIVKHGNSDACLSLALALLPLEANSTPRMKVVCGSILEAAARNLHPLVQIQLHRYLINQGDD